jgi:tRNA(Ile2) C34 agmatinyltransferase TiaS
MVIKMAITKLKKDFSEVKVEAPAVAEVIVKKGKVCERCGDIMIKTGGGRSGFDYHCNKCGLNSTTMEDY